jgi:hypothetical protein
VLAHPGYVPWPSGTRDRPAHLWILRERHGLELAPVDLVLWDESRHAVAPTVVAAGDPGVVANPLPFVMGALAHAYALGMVRPHSTWASLGPWCSSRMRTSRRRFPGS